MKNLIETVTDIWDRSSFYQNLYDIKQLKNFTDIPFINKIDLLEDQKKFPPFGSNVLVKRSELYRIHRTSGTTTKPLLLTLTKKDIEIIHEVGSDAFRTAGVEEDDIIINCMNYSMWMGGFTDHLSLEKAGGCVIPYGVGNTENLIALLLEIENPSIHCTPSYLDIIKKKLKDKFSKVPKDLGIKKGFFGGEGGLQNKEFKKRIEDEWGLEAINANYGMSDVISILGSECNEKDGLHFVAQNYLYIELVDAELNSVELKKGAVGELVASTLYKESQPLIRYRTGDIIEIISTEKCSCGNDSFRFKVVGRADDMLTIKGINFYPDSLRTIISKYSQFSVNYRIEIEDVIPLKTFKLILEKNSNNYELELEKLIIEIKNNFFVTPIIEVVDKIEIQGNKMKLLKKVRE
jgi:phenylacetate-CoA ligase